MQLEIEENVSLAPLTTLGVGGAARYFTRAKHVGDVEQAVAFAEARSLPLFVLGGGSNLVFSDRGWDGLVLQIAIGGIHQKPEAGKIIFDVGAGVDWDEFVAHSVSLNCAGVECLSGIPGSVGGTPVQNVGAYGQEVSQTVVSVMAVDLEERRTCELQATECGFSYRTSIFNSSETGRYIILRVRYALAPGGTPALQYADLKKYFAGRAVPTMAEVREAVLSIRASKGMLITPDDPDGKSAGSFFKNPVVSAGDYEALVHRASERELQIPSYPALSQQHKISAAWLVENSGFRKSYVKGRVGISSKHALAIVNRGGASAAEVMALCDEIQQGVYTSWGVRLETEPVLVGY